MPYIDRDAFIKQQRELYCKNCARRMGVKNGKLKEIYKIGEAACKSCELNDALDDLDDYPEADVAPVRHGHWEYHECVCTDEGITGVYVCSACKAAVPEAVFDFFMEGFHKDYCGACGAQMDEEVKDDDRV